MEHWMIYVGIGWAMMWLVSFKLISNIAKNRNGWDASLIIVAFLCFVISPLGWLAVIISSDDDWSYSSKNRDVYWNPSEGQIMTKGGKCLYDRKKAASYRGVVDGNRSVIPGMGKRIRALENSITCTSAVPTETKILTAQLQCSAKTKGKHKMVYKDRVLKSMICGVKAYGYKFTCSTCNLEITKSKAELTPTEREHLKGLKLL